MSLYLDVFLYLGTKHNSGVYFSIDPKIVVFNTYGKCPCAVWRTLSLLKRGISLNPFPIEIQRYLDGDILPHNALPKSTVIEPAKNSPFIFLADITAIGTKRMIKLKKYAPLRKIFNFLLRPDACLSNVVWKHFAVQARCIPLPCTSILASMNTISSNCWTNLKYSQLPQTRKKTQQMSSTACAIW